MNLSGILVVVQPKQTASMTATLNLLPGVEVRQQEPETGRLILVQEAPDVEAEMEGLRRIQALPGVALAEMVYHYFEEEAV
jgi:periplasmic nitrate reductase NapD